MAQFRKKPVAIEAITFDELVEYGRAHAASVVSGMPWSFDYAGHAITHENDDCYLIPTFEGTMRLDRGDMLITGVAGEVYPCKPDIFAAAYEPEPGWMRQARERHAARRKTPGAPLPAEAVAGYYGRREIVWRMDADDAEALADQLSQVRNMGWGDDADALYRLVDQLRPAPDAPQATDGGGASATA